MRRIVAALACPYNAELRPFRPDKLLYEATYSPSLTKVCARSQFLDRLFRQPRVEKAEAANGVARAVCHSSSARRHDVMLGI